MATQLEQPRHQRTKQRKLRGLRHQWLRTAQHSKTQSAAARLRFFNGLPGPRADVAGVRPDVAVRLSSPTACGPVGSAQRIRFAFANGLRCATVERTARRGGTLLGGGRGCAKNIGSSGATRCGLHTKTDSESIERQSTVRAEPQPRAATVARSLRLTEQIGICRVRTALPRLSLFPSASHSAQKRFRPNQSR